MNKTEASPLGKWEGRKDKNVTVGLINSTITSEGPFQLILPKPQSHFSKWNLRPKEVNSLSKDIRGASGGTRMKAQIVLKIEENLLEMPPETCTKCCRGAWEGVWLGAKAPGMEGRNKGTWTGGSPPLSGLSPLQPAPRLTSPGHLHHRPEERDNQIPPALVSGSPSGDLGETPHPAGIRPARNPRSFWLVRPQQSIWLNPLV